MIKVTVDWAIEKDRYCLILKRRAVRKKGKNIGAEIWESEAYCKDVPQLVKFMVDRELLSEAEAWSFTASYHSSLEYIVEMMKKGASVTLQEAIS